MPATIKHHAERGRFAIPLAPAQREQDNTNKTRGIRKRRRAASTARAIATIARR
ncbi:hypothetical protein G3O00_01260 [Burkholderia sp. Ac-20384]|uniref:hypothetical protein n=1 Tax=Burkholderia TaxID=32008 RepID=UPI001582008B|nr:MULTISPECIES: hypothetical protein [Burkholderia]MBN3822246.1 hypothetical protein [Burkholderia sp. Ac-20384]